MSTTLRTNSTVGSVKLTVEVSSKQKAGAGIPNQMAAAPRTLIRQLHRNRDPKY